MTNNFNMVTNHNDIDDDNDNSIHLSVVASNRKESF